MLKTPEGWDEASEETRKKWAKDAAGILATRGVVPEGSREAYAVIEDYAEQNSGKSWKRTIKARRNDQEPEEDSAQAAIG